MNKKDQKKINKAVSTTINYAGLERLNALPDLTQELNDKFLENLIIKYITMTPAQLTVSSKDKGVTIIERMIMTQIQQALKSGKGAFQYGQYLQERIAGKAKDRVEVSGPNSGPLRIERTISDKMEKIVNQLSEKELEKVDKATRIFEIIGERYAKEEEEKD
jgi:hypothetical protein